MCLDEDDAVVVLVAGPALVGGICDRGKGGTSLRMLLCWYLCREVVVGAGEEYRGETGDTDGR